MMISILVFALRRYARFGSYLAVPRRCRILDSGVLFLGPAGNICCSRLSLRLFREIAPASA